MSLLFNPQCHTGTLHSENQPKLASFTTISRYLCAKIRKDFNIGSIFPAFFEKSLKNLEISEIIPIFGTQNIWKIQI